MTAKTSPNMTTITEDDVLAWLKANPNFLTQNPEACEFLVPPKEEMGKGVADFQSYMVQRLKKDKEAVLETTRDLIEVSRLNMNSVGRIHEAALRILEATSFIEFIKAITMDIAPILDVDMAVLVVESDGQNIPNIHASGIKIVPQGTIDGWMGKETSILQSDIHGSEDIYDGGARLVRSQAILRVDISMKTPPAILAFGSRDPELFADGQGTEMVAYLARVVERAFRLWLDVPK